MKRIGCLLLAIFMVVSLTACGGSKKKEEPPFVEELNRVVATFTENSPQYQVVTKYDIEENLYTITVELNEEGIEEFLKESMTEEQLADEAFVDSVVSYTMKDSDENEELVKDVIEMYESLVSGIKFEEEFDFEVRYKNLDGEIIYN